MLRSTEEETKLGECFLQLVNGVLDQTSSL